MANANVIDYRCGLCNSIQQSPGRCHNCNYPELEAVANTPQEYCAKYGHDGGEFRREETKRFERQGIYRGGKGASWAPAYPLYKVNAYSYEFHFKCARCGFERTERRILFDVKNSEEWKGMYDYSGNQYPSMPDGWDSLTNKLRLKAGEI